MGNIPIIYVAIYHNLRKRNRGYIVQTTFLKQIIRETVVREGGISKNLVYDIIKDLSNMKLIKRINCFTYEILLNNKCQKRLKKFFW